MRSQEVIHIGTRKSPLAQAQTRRVFAQLPEGSARMVLIESEGDADATRPIHDMDRPGAFTSALTDAILDGRIHAAVHSLKDLPLAAPPQAPIVAILARDDPADILVYGKDAADPAGPLGLRPGSRVGTSAPRRQTQIVDADDSLVPIDVRGNVGTRLRLIETGVLDALVMANAAFERMTLPLPRDCASRRLDPNEFPPGPGQGALAIQARAPSHAATVLAKLDDAPTREAVDIERALLARLGGGCGMPLGAYASWTGSRWSLAATLGQTDWAAQAAPVLTRVHVEDASEANILDEAERTLTAAPVRRGRLAPRNVVAITLGPEACATYERALAQRAWAPEPWLLLEIEETNASLPIAAHDARWIAVASPHASTHAAHAYAGTRAEAPRVAALGAATARSLRRRGLPVHVVSPEATGASLAEAVARFPAAPTTVLLPQSEDALPDLEDGLAKHGFSPLRWPCYRTRPIAPPRPFPLGARVLVLTSPSNVHAFARLESRPDVPLYAFGRTTEAAMRTAGLPVARTLSHPTPTALLEALP